MNLRSRRDKREQNIRKSVQNPLREKKKNNLLHEICEVVLMQVLTWNTSEQSETKKLMIT